MTQQPENFLDSLLEAAEAIKAAQPPPQFVVLHPDDFPGFKAELEAEGLVASQPPGSSVWNFYPAVGGMVGGVVLKVAASDTAERGKALVMPIPEGGITLPRPNLSPDH